MAFKIAFIISALVACVHAGGPAAYAISAPAIDHASVGNTQEHTVKGPGGLSSQSDYTSQVQTAHSQSHVSRTSISNDAGLAPHVAAAGVIGHTGLGIAHGLALAPRAIGVAPAYPVAQALPVAPALGLAAHGLGLAHGIPALGHGIAGPLPLVKSAYAAPALVAGHGLHIG